VARDHAGLDAQTVAQLTVTNCANLYGIDLAAVSGRVRPCRWRSDLMGSSSDLEMTSGIIEVPGGVEVADEEAGSEQMNPMLDRYLQQFAS